MPPFLLFEEVKSTLCPSSISGQCLFMLEKRGGGGKLYGWAGGEALGLRNAEMKGRGRRRRRRKRGRTDW